ncbi:MAG: carbohydrate ABC transporter permease [Christensenellales bacterium]|jgi:sn-glycerol 3-phosphate transport system permease protein
MIRSAVKRSRFKKPNLYLFLLPILMCTVGFVYYPFVRTFLYSFSLVNFSGEILEIVGFSNYRNLFADDVFLLALRNSSILAITVVPLMLVISLGLALLCTNRRTLSPLYETMFSLPMAMSMTSACMVFKLLFNPTIGIVNYTLGIDFGWFKDPKTAMVGIILICVWIGIPFDFLLMLSAVRNVPGQLVESAMIDGAGFTRRLVSIMIPIISPTIMYLVCVNFVAAFMTAAPVMLITEGGPARSTTTLIYMMYTSGYQSSNYSKAACISVVTFLITFGVMALAMYYERKKVHFE